jgi:hypothetical protein
MAKITIMLIYKRIGGKQLLGAAGPIFMCNPSLYALVQKKQYIKLGYQDISPDSPLTNLSPLGIKL